MPANVPSGANDFGFPVGVFCPRLRDDSGLPGDPRLEMWTVSPDGMRGRLVPGFVHHPRDPAPEATPANHGWIHRLPERWLQPATRYHCVADIPLPARPHRPARVVRYEWSFTTTATAVRPGSHWRRLVEPRRQQR